MYDTEVIVYNFWNQNISAVRDNGLAANLIYIDVPQPVLCIIYILVKEFLVLDGNTRISF